MKKMFCIAALGAAGCFLAAAAMLIYASRRDVRDVRDMLRRYE